MYVWMWVGVCLSVYLKELTHVIVEAWQVQNLQGSCQLETQGRVYATV